MAELAWRNHPLNLWRRETCREDADRFPHCLICIHHSLPLLRLKTPDSSLRYVWLLLLWAAAARINFSGPFPRIDPAPSTGLAESTWDDFMTTGVQLQLRHVKLMDYIKVNTHCGPTIHQLPLLGASYPARRGSLLPHVTEELRCCCYWIQNGKVFIPPREPCCVFISANSSMQLKKAQNLENLNNKSKETIKSNC